MVITWLIIYYIYINNWNYQDSAYVVDSFQQLLMLEAQHGAPLQYTSAVSQLIEYYEKVIKIIIFDFGITVLLLSTNVITNNHKTICH